MNNMDLQKLTAKAGEMALRNIWGENAYKINMMILKLDRNNCAACTRLAKYYKLKNNITKAKNMYLKALHIDPNNRGAINNLSDIERDQKESDAVDQIKTTRELLKEGQSAIQKGKYNLAAKLFSRAYTIEPLLTHAFSLANAYKQMEKYDSIEELYQKLIDENTVQTDIKTINNEFKSLRLSEECLAK
ncbi:tetratricopeptide repeat protein [Cellulosilyticum sp. I15G10I2]|uniref:tetratricopeptide repeat protein n=1 Tax=Cellulosilyticum sp. I15G10I2 TaxID=1892843 RepID=UPI00085CC3E2|nr:tetratricopeptide repeat protein [Cellulosilyticum sp. I15G10I2]